MFTRTIAASVLALGLLAPVVTTQAFAAERNYACSEDQRDNSNYADCIVVKPMSDSAGFLAPTSKVVDKSDVGQFVDETREESNQRSSNR